MKQAKLLLMAFTFSCVIVNAQNFQYDFNTGGNTSSSYQPAPGVVDSKAISVSLGLTAGFNLSTLSCSDKTLDPSFGFRPGFNGNFVANLRFLKRENGTASSGIMAIQPELGYTTLGANSEDFKFGTGNLVGAVMIQVYPTRDLYLEVGPQFIFNVTHTPDNIAFEHIGINFDQLGANDMALAAGLGYKFGKFQVGARYMKGFSNVASNLPWKNSAIQINLGFFFCSFGD